MSEAFAALLEDAHARGHALALRTADRRVPWHELVELLEEDALLGRGPEPLAAGTTVALRGTHLMVRLFTPLAAWKRGLSTLHLSDREPEARSRERAREAGCAYVVASEPGPVFEAGPIPGTRGLRLPTSTLLPTSGTSGAPRIAVHRVETHLACAREAAAFFDLGEGDVWLLSLPTYHIGGLGILFRSLVSGAALAVADLDEDLHAAVERYEPTHLSLVPTQLERLLDSGIGAERLRACRAVLLGGSASSPALRERALRAGVPLYVGYGATETTAFVTASDEPEVVRRPNAAGRPLPRRRVEIAGDGEILVGGDGLFDGYLEDERVVAPFDATGTYATGDVGRLEDGVLYVDGRKDRMLVSGGENIHPEEIEAELEAIDGVAAAVVVAVDDAEFGARPVAFVEGADVTSAGLAAALRERLPGFKVPDAFYAMPADALAGLKPDIPGLAAAVRSPETYRRLRPL